jgi:heme/copper-type cytochrome/quinol oxidase subunit 2
MTDAEILVQMILVSTFAAAMIVIGIFGAMFFINDYFNKKEKNQNA